MLLLRQAIRPIRLSDVEDPTLSSQTAHMAARLSASCDHCALSPERSYFCWMLSEPQGQGEGGCIR